MNFLKWLHPSLDMTNNTFQESNFWFKKKTTSSSKEDWKEEGTPTCSKTCVVYSGSVSASKANVNIIRPKMLHTGLWQQGSVMLHNVAYWIAAVQMFNYSSIPSLVILLNSISLYSSLSVFRRENHSSSRNPFWYANNHYVRLKGKLIYGATWWLSDF